MKLLIALTFVMIATCSAIVCPVDYCARVDCVESTKAAAECIAREKSIEGAKFMFKEHASLCGCCPMCVRVLKEGDACLLTMGVPQLSQCATGLRCHLGKCAKVEPAPAR